MLTGDFNDGTFPTPFVGISKWSMGFDAFRASQKTICNPEPDGPSGPGTTKLVQRSAEAPQAVQGSLTYPLDAAVAADGRASTLGCWQDPSPAKTGGSGLDQTCQNRKQEPVPVPPLAHQRPESRIAGYHGPHRTHGGSYDAH